MADSELERINQLPNQQAQSELMQCCGSQRWSEAVAMNRPFQTRDSLFKTAERVWRDLGDQDWLEAFSHHPRIGEKGRLQKWCEQEQRGVQGAESSILNSLVEWNKKYEEKFGHVFLICATGKTAPEMLQALRARIENTPETELEIAAEEQIKITKIRLEKLLNP